MLPPGGNGTETASVTFDYEIACDKDGEVMIKNVNDRGQTGYALYVTTAIGADIDRWQSHRAKYWLVL